jgi:hypothetical protein
MSLSGHIDDLSGGFNQFQPILTVGSPEAKECRNFLWRGCRNLPSHNGVVIWQTLISIENFPVLN